MTELVVKRGRPRRTHSAQFKQEAVDQCTRPGMSLANVARQHELHPSLLARWVKERTEPARMTMSGVDPFQRTVFQWTESSSAFVVSLNSIAV